MPSPPQKHSVLEDGEAVSVTHSAPPIQSCVSSPCLAEKHVFGKAPRTGAGLCSELLLRHSGFTRESTETGSQSGRQKETLRGLGIVTCGSQ